MRERGRPLLIFAVVALVFGGAAFYFLGIYRPAQARREAQAEVARWEMNYVLARSCLVGATQASTSIAEAVAVRALAAEGGLDRSSCTKLVGALNRSDGADASQIDEVERMWSEIDFAASNLANAYARHVDRSRRPKPGDEETFAKALTEMDAARDRLRKAASLPPVAPAAKGTLPRGEVTMISTPEQSTGMIIEPILSSGAIAAPTTFNTLVVAQPGRAPQRLTTNLAMRSLPDVAWGASNGEKHIDVGSIDEAGSLTPQSTLKLADRPSVMFALGNAERGVVAFTTTKPPSDDEDELDVGLGARLAFTQVAAGKAGPALAQVAVTTVRYGRTVDGRAAVVWTDAADRLFGAIVRPGEPITPIELGTGRPSRVCLTDTHAWVGTEEYVRGFDASGALPPVDGDFTLVSCGKDAAILHTPNTTTFAVCRAGCRTVELRGAFPSAVPVLVGDTLHAVGGGERKVLGVWRERGAPSYVAVPEAFTPTLGMTDGKTIEVLGRVGSHLAVAKLPPL